MPALAATTGRRSATPRGLRTIDDLIGDEERRFRARQPRSLDCTARAARSLAGGATSSWQIARPATVWLSHGQGSKVYDVDGTEYVDLHAGYGAMLAGHGHPAIVAAVSERVGRGTHFAQPTEDAIVVAELLAARFGLPLWRFGNSGTEATMDAVHLMRAATGRDLIVKVEGSYHGHHDSVMVSYYNQLDELGPRERPHSVLAGTGIPQAMAELVAVVPFNDLDVLAAVLDANQGRVAGMIMEPMMMNAGIVVPEPGYLEGVRRLTREHGVLLAFDEVKTGLTVGPGGVTALLGVQPDIVCLAKALGGGVPCGAIGGTAEVMEPIVDGSYQQVGTFNGNPLTMAAARATLTAVLTPDAYAHFDLLGERMRTAALKAFRRAAHPRLRAALRRQGMHRVPPHPGARLSRVPRRARRAEPRPLARAAQPRRVPTAVGQVRAMDPVGAAHHRRRRPLRRQRRGVRRHPRPPRPLGERPRPSRSTSSQFPYPSVEARPSVERTDGGSAGTPVRFNTRMETWPARRSEPGSMPTSVAAAMSTHARSSSRVTALSCTVTCTARPSSTAAMRHALACGSGQTNVPSATPSSMTASRWCCHAMSRSWLMPRRIGLRSASPQRVDPHHPPRLGLLGGVERDHARAAWRSGPARWRARARGARGHAARRAGTPPTATRPCCRSGSGSAPSTRRGGGRRPAPASPRTPAR